MALGYAKVLSVAKNSEETPKRNKENAPVRSKTLVVGGHGDICCLPSEILVLICCLPEISARDLVALDGTCSRFHQKNSAQEEFSSITEQAAMIKINDRRLFSDVLTLPFNLKALYHFTKEMRNLPVFSCAKCSWRVGGFRCQGKRPPHLVRKWRVADNTAVPVPTGCGTYLVWDETRNLLVCPFGCGTIIPPSCTCLAYLGKSEKNSSKDHPPQKYFEDMTFVKPSKLIRTNNLTVADVESTNNSVQLEDMYLFNKVSKKTPSLTCVSCGFTVDGYVCLGKPNDKAHVPKPFRQVGFYERVWCSYRWACPQHCRVIRAGPEDHNERRSSYESKERAFLSCVSKSDCDTFKDLPFGKRGTEMASLEWVDSLGPPSN